MGTKSPIENKFLNYRAFQRKRVRKAKLARPNAELGTLQARRGNRQKYVTAKAPKKNTTGPKKLGAMATRHIKIAEEKKRRIKQIQEAQSKGLLQGINLPEPKRKKEKKGPKETQMGE